MVVALSKHIWMTFFGSTLAINVLILVTFGGVHCPTSCLKEIKEYMTHMTNMHDVHQRLVENILLYV